MPKWTMPDWMGPYADMFTELIDRDVEKTMDAYSAKCADLMASPVGRALATNAQVGLLVALRARGLLKDLPPCPVDGAGP